MKQVLGIVASPRPLGNCEIMLKQISRELELPHQLQLLRLQEFNLKPCNGCYRCLRSSRGCVLKDDLKVLLDAIAAADALILVAPTYFLAAPACLKSFIDRAISFYSRAEQLWGKPAIGLGIAGIKGKEGSTLLDIERFFTTLLAETKQCAVAYGALPGEVLLPPENRALAKQLAQALFAPPAPPQEPYCHCCGGTNFRFYPDNRVRCLLCSETGEIVATAGGLKIEMSASEQRFLGDKSVALHHRDWLSGMLERYKEQKETLAAIREPFKDTTRWIGTGKETKDKKS